MRNIREELWKDAVVRLLSERMEFSIVMRTADKLLEEFDVRFPPPSREALTKQIEEINDLLRQRISEGRLTNAQTPKGV